MESGLYERIYEVVKSIPAGAVATYGDIALAVGMPRGARQVGYAMAALGRGVSRPDIPWHRVVNARGEARVGEEQIVRLRAEGIAFGAEGRIDLEQCGWNRDTPEGQGLFE